VIRCNFRALQNGDFQTLGQMLATMIIQGGQHPRIFSPSICDYIAHGLDKCKPSIEEIYDGTVRNSLKMVPYFIHAHLITHNNANIFHIATYTR
jgi:hypothetical protein